MQRHHRLIRAATIPMLKALLAYTIIKYFESEIDLFCVFSVNTVLYDDLLQVEEPTLSIAAIRLMYLHQQLRNGMRDLLHKETVQKLMGNILERLANEDQGKGVSHGKKLYQTVTSYH